MRPRPSSRRLAALLPETTLRGPVVEEEAVVLPVAAVATRQAAAMAEDDADRYTADVTIVLIRRL